MNIGKVDTVDVAATRPPTASAPPTSAPTTPAQRTAIENPVFPPAQAASPQVVAAAVQSANAYVQAASAGIQFSLDEDSGRTVVKLIDTETSEVLRQFPTEEMLVISKSIDRMQGLLIDRKA